MRREAPSAWLHSAYAEQIHPRISDSCYSSQNKKTDISVKDLSVSVVAGVGFEPTTSGL